MDPIIVKQGESARIRLTGFNFVKRSAVYFNGKPVPFRVASPTEIEINLDAESLREAGRFNVVVKIRSRWTRFICAACGETGHRISHT